MGKHRCTNDARRRGIARWPIVAGGLLVLLGLGWAGWNWGQSILTARARTVERAFERAGFAPPRRTSAASSPRDSPEQ